MAPKSCKKPVYATMCESDDGRRTGKYRGNRYESHRKKTATKTTKVRAVRKTPAKMMKAVPVGFDDPRTAYDMAADRRLDDLEAQDFWLNSTKLNAGRKDDEELRVQNMYLKDAWMKRQASKRKKYGTAAKAVPVASAPVKAKKKYIPKDEYDQLYFYVNGKYLPRILKGELDPFNVRSNRRYNNIDDARKAALARSKKNWAEISVTNFPMNSLDVAIFKGKDYVGTVEYNTLKGKDNGIHDYFDGLWIPKDHPKDPSPILDNGKIGSRPVKRRA